MRAVRCLISSSLGQQSSTKTSIPISSKPFEMNIIGQYRRRFITTQATEADSPQPDPEFKIVSEEVIHQRYLTLYDRAVQFPPITEEEKTSPVVHRFDVIGHPKANFHFCVTFPYHPPPPGTSWKQGRVTLVREYAQGPNELVFCLPTGSFDPKKHKDLEDCAKAELSEEALLRGGSMERLLGEEAPGVPEVKWCANRFTPFICISPQPDEAPGSRDMEEFIEVVEVSIPELRKIMKSGKMMLPSVTTCWWALEYLATRAEGENEWSALEQH